jgi:hypothetical protein
MGSLTTAGAILYGRPGNYGIRFDVEFEIKKK